MHRLVLIIVAVLVCWSAPAADLSGHASIIDGDTIEIHGQRIRLFGIDAYRQYSTAYVGEEDAAKTARPHLGGGRRARTGDDFAADLRRPPSCANSRREARQPDECPSRLLCHRLDLDEDPALRKALETPRPAPPRFPSAAGRASMARSSMGGLFHPCCGSPVGRKMPIRVIMRPDRRYDGAHPEPASQ